MPFQSTTAAEMTQEDEIDSIVWGPPFLGTAGAGEG